jgi:DegV family protein with EDD domain
MKKSSIAVVTDSTADIPNDLLEQYSIHMVNNIVMIEGKSFVDRIDIKRQEFYEKLPGMKIFPTTGTASSEIYQKIYEKLFQGGIDKIISIHASKKLSGIFNAASLAAQAFDQRVVVLDSEMISLGLGFQALAAAEAILQGLSFENILKILEDIRRRVRLVAMLDTLEFIRRSGRVSWLRARLGDVLRIKPLVEVKNGEVLSLGEVRTYRKGFDRLMSILTKIGPIERLAVLHTNAEQEARDFLRSISFNPSAQPLIINVTTVIGSHVGPHGLGFVAVLRKS